MKIIQQGQQKEPLWIGRWACSDCKCVWEMEESDKKPDFHTAENQRDDNYYFMPCPYCKRITEKYRKA